MNFGELRFWLLLFGGLAIIFPLSWLCKRFAPSRAVVFDKIALATLGLGLLMAVNWLTWIIFVTVMLIAYLGMKSALRLNQPTAGLAIILPLLFLPLLYYKYADFVVRGVLSLQYDSFRDLAIPVGISFYTFQKAAAVVDTLVLKKSLPRFLDFVNFAAFFPQIVAGPIERREDLLPQMEQFRFRLRAENLAAGIPWLALGFFFKRALADNFAEVFNGNSVSNPYSIWLANLIFGLRVYFDFAGYSFIALGIARCLGIRLTLNFRNPYCAVNPVEFWRRWHITLSQWFRDYIYVPLGGGRTRFWALTVLVVFITSGLWHGAGWNFLLWGLLHALYLIACRLLGKRTFPAPLAWGGTMVAVFFAWMFFHETRQDILWQKTTAIFNPAGYAPGNLMAMIAAIPGNTRVVMAGLFAVAFVTLAVERWSLRDESEPYWRFRTTAAAALLIALACWLGPEPKNDFIYFAF